MNDGVLGDDYVYDKFETWKIKTKNDKGTKVDYKVKVKDNTSTWDDELKLQFPYKNYWAWVGVRRKGDLKLHFDLGSHSFGGKEFNLFTNIKTSVQLKKFAFRFGANYFGTKCESNSRLETSCCSAKNLCFTNRTLVRKGSIFYGFVGSLSLENFCPCRYDAIFGYEKDNVNFYL